MARPSLVIESRSTLGVFWHRVPQQIGAQGRCHSRQWRMLRLPLVDAFVQPLHTAGNVGGFVVGVVEDRVGGDNADGCQQDQGHGDGQPMAFQKGFAGQGAKPGRAPRGASIASRHSFEFSMAPCTTIRRFLPAPRRIPGALCTTNFFACRDELWGRLVTCGGLSIRLPPLDAAPHDRGEPPPLVCGLPLCGAA